MTIAIQSLNQVILIKHIPTCKMIVDVQYMYIDNLRDRNKIHNYSTVKEYF